MRALNYYYGDGRYIVPAASDNNAQHTRDYIQFEFRLMAFIGARSYESVCGSNYCHGEKGRGVHGIKSA
jgi:hypothetical protein